MANKNIGRARILQQIKNMQKDKVDYLHAQPLESDLYTWHFTFRGPQNTDFHEGLYHGQIILPFQYPFKPPDIIFANKNGRFQVNTKICLTITQYHTQQWNSAWTIRTMLQAVISLFNERVVGHGYLESSSDARRFFAKASHDYTCQKCGKISDVIKPRQSISKSKQTQMTLLAQEKKSQLKEKQQYQYHEKQQQLQNKDKQKDKDKQYNKNIQDIYEMAKMRKISGNSQVSGRNFKESKLNNNNTQTQQSRQLNRGNLKTEQKQDKQQNYHQNQKQKQQRQEQQFRIHYLDSPKQFPTKTNNKTKTNKKSKKISPQQFLYQNLMRGNQEYRNVIKSKKLIIE